MTTTVRSRAETVAMLLRIGVIPVVRCDAADVAVRVAEALFGAGLPVVEITMTVPGALDAIAKLARRRRLEKTDRVLVGAGTVTDAADARDAIAAGADFIVSPGHVREVSDVARAAGVAMLPGALTPTEILAAKDGADLIKIFPAQAVGGAAYIRALRGPFADLLLVPTGGVDLTNAADFIRAGASAVGVGSELVSRDALAREDYDAIGKRAAQFVAAVAGARKHTKGA
jgi:2-dehydro-3-deoxyphosphogluconate aldolase/(4S)-4-hydroxy-2-oxoglutarate aldolase